MVYPALQPVTRTPRLPVVDWTDAPADLNGLVRFAKRRNLLSAPVPWHFKLSLQECNYAQAHYNFRGHYSSIADSILVRFPPSRPKLQRRWVERCFHFRGYNTFPPAPSVQFLLFLVACPRKMWFCSPAQRETPQVNLRLPVVPLGTVVNIFKTHKRFHLGHWFKNPYREIRWVGTYSWDLRRVSENGLMIEKVAEGWRNKVLCN
jgi:hypothetical protein